MSGSSQQQQLQQYQQYRDGGFATPYYGTPVNANALQPYTGTATRTNSQGNVPGVQNPGAGMTPGGMPQQTFGGWYGQAPNNQYPPNYAQQQLPPMDSGKRAGGTGLPMNAGMGGFIPGFGAPTQTAYMPGSQNPLMGNDAGNSMSSTFSGNPLMGNTVGNSMGGYNPNMLMTQNMGQAAAQQAAAMANNPMNNQAYATNAFLGGGAVPNAQQILNQRAAAYQQNFGNPVWTGA